MLADPFRDSIVVDANPTEVFSYFTHAERLAKWMGDDARLEPRPGGRFTVFFGSRAVEGHYVEVDPPRRLVISWGRQGSADFPPGTSTLEVTLDREGTGTRVSVVHWGLPEVEREVHRLGWRHYLARLRGVLAGDDLPPHQTPGELTRGVN